MKARRQGPSEATVKVNDDGLAGVADGVPAGLGVAEAVAVGLVATAGLALGGVPAGTDACDAEVSGTGEGAGVADVAQPARTAVAQTAAVVSATATADIGEAWTRTITDR